MTESDASRGPNRVGGIVSEEQKRGLLSKASSAVATGREKMAEASARREEAKVEAGAEERSQRDAMRAQGHELYEYRVLVLRQTLVGDHMKTDELEATLNQWAASGWEPHLMTETEVKGRMGPGGTGGLVIVMRRRHFT
jgi:cobalamin-dependent methionine synthase I